ncbi:tRNA(Met) cytidine acetyltransferase TmcA [Marinobacterium sediminicola]|uniref:tRNA(Met) cytidine acetyltransferase TmcA n=1 Tax=Marinobacterium sediminicola TaxID=518898 RepID=A0ABY1RWD1_9GAMM|nr:GNAT family N-acetyltransferase [Marinobacterium sediminicola]ULG70344.1 GNAT family N-acetyltransferase [Marinobacterium sediminicola]SMR69667.1 tRNA(Met) cytidine acetyltransferase [Marinobacterium sediminicola]
MNALLLARLREQLCRQRQRLLVWLSGEEAWCHEQLAGPLSLWLQGQGVLVGDTPVAGLSPVDARRVHSCLGQTLDYAVIDAFAGFNPNAFGQISGAVQGGGCVVLMTPSPERWVDFPDPEYVSLCVEPYRPEQLRGQYLIHLVKVLTTSGGMLHWQQGQAPVLPELPMVDERTMIEAPFRSVDQMEAVELILETAGKRQQPLVLSADRGRGKSAALGIAAARLLQAGKRVAVTAFSRNAIAALLERVEALAPECVHRVAFYRPDELLHAEVQADLLLVDEAAAIPTPLLSEMVAVFPRTVFATTLHGYEGNGQGFALRFMQLLRSRYPRCREYRLCTPIRWASPDPLEHLSNRLLLLDVDAGSPDRLDAELEVVRVSQQTLVDDTELLRNVFGLLVLAHYRTTPGDLRIMLDSPNIRIYLVRSSGVPVACALLAEEGPLPDTLAQAVWGGRRRPRGHLLPQTLVAQEGWLEAAPWRALRVVRIAVHPEVQKFGVGSLLLGQIEQDAVADQIDYLGASFAASPSLLQFWLSNGFRPLRLGEQRDPVAGSHALLVLKPLSENTRHFMPEMQRWYRRSLLQRLPGMLKDLEAEHLPALLQNTAAEQPLAPSVLQRLKGFGEAQRSLESSLIPLRELLEASIDRWGEWQLSVVDQRLLCDRIIRQLPPAAVTAPEGKRAQLDRLRQLCTLLLAKLAAESPSGPQY